MSFQAVISIIIEINAHKLESLFYWFVYTSDNFKDSEKVLISILKLANNEYTIFSSFNFKTNDFWITIYKITKIFPYPAKGNAIITKPQPKFIPYKL